MMHSPRFRSILVLALMVVGSVIGIDVKPASATPTQLTYIVMPHMDDEYEVWSKVAATPSNYKVFIYMTQGEESSSCLNLTDGYAAGLRGPYWYEGPLSPAGEPDYNEINPRGTGNSVWTGKWSANCIEGRRNGLGNFLNDKSATDSSIPNGWALQGVYSIPGNTVAGLPPQRTDNNGTLTYTSRTAIVLSSLNGMGTIVIFDLGDGDLKKEEVAWATVAVEVNQTTFGIPNLPQAMALGAFRHDGSLPPCHLYNHPDHIAIHQALFQYDLFLASQYGRTCSNDPDQSTNATVPLADFNATFAMTGTQRIGPQQRRYGWLTDDYYDTTNSTCSQCIFAQQQYFWVRF